MTEECEGCGNGRRSGEGGTEGMRRSADDVETRLSCGTGKVLLPATPRLLAARFTE